MIIILLTYSQIKLIMSLLNGNMENMEAVQKILQDAYDKVAYKLIADLRLNNGGNFDFVLEDGTTVSGHFRLNGRNKEKTISFGEGAEFPIKLVRLRCDDLKACRCIMLNIFIPRCKILLGDTVEIIINDANRMADMTYSSRQMTLIRRKWSRWSNIITGFKGSLTSLKEYCRLVDYSVRILGRHFLQLSGKKCHGYSVT